MGKGGTKTDPTETVAPVTIADDTEAKSDMETHVVYSLKEAAECEKVKKSTKTSKFVEKLCASIKTFGSLDDTVAKTCTVSTTCDTKTATTAVKHTGLKQADAITAMSAILKKTLAACKTDLEAAKNADDALKAITVSEPTSVVVKLTDAASSSTDKTDKDKDKTTDAKKKKISGDIVYDMTSEAECTSIKGSTKFQEKLCNVILEKANLKGKTCKITTTCAEKKTTSSFVVTGLTAEEATAAKNLIEKISKSDLKQLLIVPAIADDSKLKDLKTPATISSTQSTSKVEFKTPTAADCAALQKSQKFNQALADDFLTKAGLDPATDKDKGACTTACGRRRLESTARSLATPTKTTSTVVVKGLTANQAKTLEAKASAQDATQVKALLDTAIKADTSLPEMDVSGVKTITTKSEQVTEQTNQKISIPMKYNVDSAASCKLIQDSTKFHESIKKSTASWTEGSTADCTAVTSCPAARRLAADGRRLAKVAVTTTSTQSGLTELQAKKGKVVVEGMAATKI